MPKRAKSTKAYPKELREKAVKLVTDCGDTVDQVAEQLGCSRESIRQWNDAKVQKLDPEIALRIELEENELKRLRKENVRLRMENDFTGTPCLSKRRRVFQ